MAKSRFSKGQEIFKVELHKGEILGITKHTVKSCGKINLVLEVETGFLKCNHTYNPDQRQGELKNRVVMFHATLEEAEQAKRAFYENENN